MVRTQDIWRKSSYSQPNGNCVEVGLCACRMTHVRDLKNPGAELSFTREDWAAFITAIKEGRPLA